MYVLLVSYLPPPMGGIANWTSIILHEERLTQSNHILLINIAPHWRSIHQKEIWRRVLGGFMQLIMKVTEILSKIIKYNPKIIHICSPAHLAVFRDITFLLIAKFFSIKRIYHLRFGRLPGLAQKNNWEWKALTIAIKLADLIIVLDIESIKTLKKYFPGKSIEKIPNCLNKEKLLQEIFDCESEIEKSDCIRFIYIGWVIPEKGLIEILEAAYSLKKRPFKIEIIGPSSSSFSIRLEEYLSKLEGKVSFWGELSHKKAMSILYHSDVLLLPSYTEGFPNVVLEALALGKPVIGSNVGAIPEILLGNTNSPCGLIVEPRDVLALSKAMEGIIFSPDILNFYSKNSLDRFEKYYSSDKTVNILNSLWGGL